MTMTSFPFFVLVGGLLVLYYYLPSRCQPYLLILASFIFCWYAGGRRMLLFLSMSIFTTWVSALLLERTTDRGKKYAILGSTIALNLGILFIFKYLNFFVYTGQSVGHTLGIEVPLQKICMVAPLGLSFYTLQVLGYLLDVSRKTCRAETSLLRYMLFAGFFPQLVQGPINRYGEMAQTLYLEKKFNYEKVTFGLQRMVWGLFKKLVISERMAVIVGTIYGDYFTYSGFYIGIGTVCFAVQLYADFSGAMDIALGLSEALGIRMLENFDTPFFSRSVSEYWRRWHITLGTWMKDYVFYPLLKSDLFVAIGEKAKKRLGKKRGKKIPTYLGMVILWFTVGLWHGGEWKYIIGSGLLHCFYIISGQLLDPAFKKIISIFRINTACFGYYLFQMLRTFFLVCIGFVFFRAGTVKEAFQMLRASLFFNPWIFIDGSLFRLGLDPYDLSIGIIAILIFFSVSLLQQHFHAKGKTLRSRLAEQKLPFRWMIYYGMIFSILIFGFYGPGYDVSTFIYQNF